MKTAIVAGATGLIGRELVQKLISSDEYRVIYLVSRRESGLAHPKIKEVVTGFDLINQLHIDETIDEAFCTLGTTMKKAGSRELFKKIDYQYVIAFANLAKVLGATKFVVISSMGADPKSRVFYNNIKGMTELSLKGMGFKHLVILRPSLLLGKRTEFRLAEQLSGYFMRALNFLIPDNFKAIRGETVAEYMVKMASTTTDAVSIIKSGEIRRDNH